METEETWREILSSGLWLVTILLSTCGAKYISLGNYGKIASAPFGGPNHYAMQITPFTTTSNRSGITPAPATGSKTGAAESQTNSSQAPLDSLSSSWYNSSRPMTPTASVSDSDGKKVPPPRDNLLPASNLASGPEAASIRRDGSRGSLESLSLSRFRTSTTQSASEEPLHGRLRFVFDERGYAMSPPPEYTL